MRINTPTHAAQPTRGDEPHQQGLVTFSLIGGHAERHNDKQQLRHIEEGAYARLRQTLSVPRR